MSERDDWTSMSGRDRRRFTLRLLETFGALCCICGLPIRDGEESTQHLVPRSKGGQTTLDNCRPAHRSCNYGLKDKISTGPSSEIHDGLGWFTQ